MKTELEMKFIGRTVHNSYDTKVEKDKAGCINIIKRLDKRVGLVYRAIERLGSANVGMITDHINTRIGTNYRDTEIAYAIKKLCSVEMIVRSDGNEYKCGKVTPNKVTNTYLNRLYTTLYKIKNYELRPFDSFPECSWIGA